MADNTIQHQWRAQYDARKRVARRFGSIWNLPIQKRYSSVLGGYLSDSQRVLEIGASDRHLKSWIQSLGQDISYVSLDSDPAYQHEFTGIEQLTGEYDVVFALEVIEHLSLRDARTMAETCASCLATGGHLLLTTPNVFYPTGYLRDATHVTAFCYDELGGLLEEAGLKVTSIYRLYHDPLVQRILRRYIAYPLFRLLKIDFAEQIMVVAEKQEPA